MFFQFCQSIWAYFLLILNLANQTITFRFIQILSYSFYLATVHNAEADEWEGVRFHFPPKRLFFYVFPLESANKSNLPPAMLIYLPDPLNFLVQSLTVYCA